MTSETPIEEVEFTTKDLGDFANALYRECESYGEYELADAYVDNYIHAHAVKGGVGYTVSLSFSRFGGRFFVPREGVEDDDHPDFVGGRLV